MFIFSMQFRIGCLLSVSWFVFPIFMVMLSHSCAENICGNCTSYCDEMTGVCNGECETNFYGDKCQFNCDNCKGKCDKDTGKCFECWFGKYGDYCNKSCAPDCSGCNQTTGVCDACSRGYYGEFCDIRCPSNCNGCNREGHCFYCRKGKWGQQCENNCPENCDSGCNKMTGACSLCKPLYRGKFCQIRCKDTNCELCSLSGNTEVCYKCVKGYFGDNCDKNCTGNCLLEGCSQQTGGCAICKKGWFGEMCENQCYVNCARCIDNTTCIECMDGYYGDRCENTCRAECKSCTRDGHRCYACRDENARSYESYDCICTVSECMPLKFDCQTCKNPSWFPSNYVCCPCNERHCNNATGNNNTCGISGDPKCPGSCQPGYFGTYCNKECYPHCGGTYHPCDKDTGYCSLPCDEGWHGTRCDVHCKEHYPHCTQCKTTITGKNSAVWCTQCENGYQLDSRQPGCTKCEHCMNNACNFTNGLCLEGCEKGYFYDYRKRCRRSCENCFGGDCHDNGTCIIPGCKPGYYNNGCIEKCPSNCLTDECDAVSGECLRGCKQGYFAGRCYNKCPDRCRDDVCNRTTGKCIECKSAFWGDNCENSCSGCIDGVCTHPEGCRHGCKPGLFSEFCNLKCLDECEACDQFTGICSLCSDNEDGDCLQQERPPWTMSPSDFPSNGSCSSGMYGPQCNMTCPSGCLSVESQVSICDRFTGTCLYSGCKQGLYGMYCEKNCSMCDVEGLDSPSCDRINGECFRCRNGRFGTLCQDKCESTCLDNTCLQKSGYCHKGCKPGWTGDKCEVRLEISGQSTIWQTVMAVVLPIVAILAITVIVVIYCKQGSKLKRYKLSKSNEVMM